MISNKIKGSLMLASIVGASTSHALDTLEINRYQNSAIAIKNAQSILNTIDMQVETQKSLDTKVKILKELMKKARFSGYMKEGPDTEDFSIDITVHNK